MAKSPDPLIDTQVRHAVYLGRVAGGLHNDFLPFLDAMKKDINARLMDEGQTPTSQRKLNKMIADINAIQKGVYAKYGAQLDLDLQDLAQHEADFETATLAATALLVEFERPAPAQVWTAAQAQPLTLPGSQTTTLLEPFIKNWSDAEIQRVQQVIRFGFVEGKTINQIASDITGKNGVLNKQARRNHKSIVRTAVNHISTAARESVMQQNDDIVIGYTIVATLDNRTTNICKGYDQMQVKFTDKKQPKPPFHVNCRTVTVPLLDERFTFDDTTEKRPAVGPDPDKSDPGSGRSTVSSKLDYYQWLKKQGSKPNGREFVEDILGKSRAKLFLDGGLSVKDFKDFTLAKDGTFNPISLDELRGKASLTQAFSKAGLTQDS